MKARCFDLMRVVVAALFAWTTVAGAASLDTGSDGDPKTRAQMLISQMTLDEKIGQLREVFKISQEVRDALPPGDHSPIPDIDSLVAKGVVGSVILVADTTAEADRIQHVAVESSRLHVPLLIGADVLHGFDTIFPVPIGLAASWDLSLVRQAQAVAASEARAGGVNWTFAPMVDIARDPRWGRIVEGAGEDPYLGAAMARAQVRGFQGDQAAGEQRIDSNHVLASLKHFAGYGASEGGRDYDAVNLSEEALRNTILPPFLAGVKAGVGTVMSGYMVLNGVPASGNRWLLQDVLRAEWGFAGFVVSDNGAVANMKTQGFARDDADADLRGFIAGVDMAMGPADRSPYDTLAESIRRGRLSNDDVTAAVSRVLQAKIRLGLFEHPYIDETQAKADLAARPEHRALALRAAEESAVLLKNEGGFLPLRPAAYHRVAVIGPLGDSRQDTRGPWLFPRDNGEAVTVFEGLRNRLGSRARVRFLPGVQALRIPPSPFEFLSKAKSPKPWDEARARQEMREALALARESDLVVLVLGEDRYMSGEFASRASLDLPGGQRELLEQVASLHKPTVLVLLSGRPLNIAWANDHLPAILEAWYPGCEGGNAIANLLLGVAVPGGKLPFTWPRDVGQIPMYYDHTLPQNPENVSARYWDANSSALFPFGHGVSYSTFELTNLNLSASRIEAGGSVDVSADLENTGNVAADEVAQLYIHQRYGSAARPVRELKGFQRIALKPHEKTTVHFRLDAEALRYWSAAAHGWVNDAATFDIWIGPDSNASLHAELTVEP